MRRRLDVELVARRMVTSRSQAESWIKLGQVMVEGRLATKPGMQVTADVPISLLAPEQYVSRAGLKLASVARVLALDFTDTTVLDVGSSTGGFTDFALRHGATRVYAVDVGTEQLHPSLRSDKRIELHEKTDIRQIEVRGMRHEVREDVVYIDSHPDIVVIDVSFISLREILPHISRLVSRDSKVVAMVKPQFEAGRQQVNKGIIKNDSVRRAILHEFEVWVKRYFTIQAKADSEVAGGKGNRERFYVLTKVK